MRPSRRRTRTPNVEKLRRQGDLSGLQAALAYTDRMVGRDGGIIDRGASVRVTALQALAEMERQRAAGRSPELPPTEVVSWLGRALADESEQVGRAAAEALGTVGTRAAADELVEFVAVKGPAAHPEVRAAALEAFCASGRPGITEQWCRKVLEERFGGLDDVDRRELAVIMGADTADQPERNVFRLLVPKLAPDVAGVDRPGPAEVILSWCMPAEFDEVAPLLELREVPEASVRLAGLSGDQALLQPLVRLLERDRATLRREAVAALGALCDTAAVLPLLGATSDPDVTVRRRAVAALDSLGSAGVTAAMAMLAHAGDDRQGVMDTAPAPAVAGDRWVRTLERLAERTGLRPRARRKLPDDDGNRQAGLMSARKRYESLAAGADLSKPPWEQPPSSGSSGPAD